MDSKVTGVPKALARSRTGRSSASIPTPTATRSTGPRMTKADGTPVTVYVNEQFEVVSVETR
jgi:hypothetical protein